MTPFQHSVEQSKQTYLPPLLSSNSMTLTDIIGPRAVSVVKYASAAFAVAVAVNYGSAKLGGPHFEVCMGEIGNQTCVPVSIRQNPQPASFPK